MNSSRHSFDSVPTDVVQSLRALFNRLDRSQSGFIHFQDIFGYWHKHSNNLPPNIPANFLNCLRKVTPSNGLLTFERFAAGFRLAVVEAKSNLSAVQTGSPLTVAHSSSSPTKNSTRRQSQNYYPQISSLVDPVGQSDVALQPRVIQPRNSSALNVARSSNGTCPGRPPDRALRASIDQGARRGVSAPPRPPLKTSRGIVVARQIAATDRRSPSQSSQNYQKIDSWTNYENWEHLQQNSAIIDNSNYARSMHHRGSCNEMPSRSSPNIGKDNVAAALIAWKHSQMSQRRSSSGNQSPLCNSTPIASQRSSFLDANHSVPADQWRFIAPLAHAQSQPALYNVRNDMPSSNMLLLPNEVVVSKQNFTSEITLNSPTSSFDQPASTSSSSPPQDPVARSASSRSFSEDIHFNERAVDVSHRLPPIVKLRQKVSNNVPNDGRRHTLSDIPDAGILRHKRSLVEEKELLQKGEDMATRLRNWYNDRLKSLETRDKFLAGGTSVLLDFAVHEEKLNFLRAHVTEVNRRIVMLMETSEKGFPSQVNAQQGKNILQPSDDEVRWLKKQNQLLSDEVSEKASLVAVLLREQNFLAQQLQQAQSERSGNPSRLQQWTSQPPPPLSTLM